MTEAARILVVDDEPIVLVSIRKILNRAGHEVETATTAAEALEKLETEHFDLIITDLIMPELSGMELLKILDRKSISVPSIMITGYPTIRTGVEALRLGATDYVPKPFTRQELLNPVQRALRQQAGEPEAEAADDEEPAAAGAVEPDTTYYLPKHSWATYRQDGTVEIGVEDAFLFAAGDVAEIETPVENDLLEQGYPSITLKTAGGESHNVFAPVSGRVVDVNAEALADPGQIDGQTWLLRILPARIDEEVRQLKRRG